MTLLKPDGTNSTCPVIWLGLAVSLLVTVLAGAVRAQIEDGQWWDGFGRAGTTGRIEALAIYEGDLIAAGEFGYAGATRAASVARWNGTYWDPLGEGTGCPFPVLALAVYKGYLYAGVACDDRGGTGDPCNNCMHRWDGASWEPVGIKGIMGWPWPVIYTVDALQVYDGKLFVGGYFTTEGGNPGNHLLQWDGEEWTATEFSLNGPVTSMTVHQGSLVIGGKFTRVDTTTVNRIVTWDGDVWQPLGTGMAPQDTGDSIAVYAVHVHNDCLIAGGNFTEAGGVAVDRLASWDGMGWSSLGFEAGEVSDSYGPRVTTLASYDGILIAGGVFERAGGAPGDYIASLDDADWESLGSGMDDRVRTLIIHEGELYAGGDFRFAGGVPVYHVAAWNGESWHSLGPEGMGMAAEVTQLVEFGGRVVASGHFDIAGDTPVGYIATWNGSGWEPIARGFKGSVRNLAVFDGNLVGVADVAVGVAGRVLKRWDGVSWQALGEDFPTPATGIDFCGNRLLVGGGDGVWEWGGDVAYWDGTSWEFFGRTRRGPVRAFEVFDGYIIAGGNFPAIQDGSGETIARCIAAWDGIKWTAMGDGLEGPSWWGQACVSDLMVRDGRLIAGGTFRRSGETQLRHIAAWDGEAWTSIGTGVNGRVYALTEYNETLVAGGAFTEAGGTEANHVARWNGTEWVPFGSGVDFDVKSLLAHDGYLYVGGKFKVAAGRASYHMARWEDRFPGMVLGFQSAPADTAVRLTWTNPSSERFEGTVIRFSREGYPDSPEDGEPVPNGNQGSFTGAAGRDTSFIHCGLGNGGTFYYTAFAYDEALTYSTPAHAYAVVPDVFAPDLSLAILQNPYLSQYLDVYLVGSEALDPASVELSVGDQVVEIVPVDTSNRVWLGDYKLKATDDSVTVAACAADYAENHACATSVFRACPIEEGGRRVIASLDDRLRLVIDQGSLAPGTYLLILPCPQADSAENASSLPGGVAHLADRVEAPGGYRISPPGILKGCAAHIEYKYASEDLTSDKTIDQLYIEQDGMGPLESYVDEHKQIVSAQIRTPGTFWLGCGEPGSSRIMDFAFLDLEHPRPNPFSTWVSVRFEIRGPQAVCASVHDVRGRQVVNLLNTVVRPGVRELTWDGRNAEGQWVPSGVYFLRLQTDHRQATRKLAILR